MFVNPFFAAHVYDQETILTVTDTGKHVRIFEHDHVLQGVVTPEQFLQRFSLIPNEAHRAMLQDLNMIAEKPFDRAELLTQAQQAHRDPAHQRLVLYPSLNCDCACTYCAQPHAGNPSMSTQQYESIDRYIARLARNGMRSLAVVLFGGEPMLEAAAWEPWFIRWHEQCRQMDIQFAGKAITNGRLLRDASFTNRVLEAGCTHFQITVDGPARFHNALRPGGDGAVTYGEVLAGLSNLAHNQSMKLCTIRINHTWKTCEASVLEEWFQDLLSATGGDPRFQIHHTRVTDLGAAINDEIPQKNFLPMLPELERLTAAAGLHVQFLDSPGASACYAGSPNTLLVLPNGELAKCTAYIDEPINRVGKLKDDGTLELNSNFERWIEPAHLPTCHACVRQPQCLGSVCPRASLLRGPVCPGRRTDFSTLRSVARAAFANRPL